MGYEPGQEVVPGYTLVGRLGSGMAGEVWIAQAAGGIHVAVKIIHNLSLIGGRKELGALKTIRNVKHPNLCPIFGFWTKDASGRILEEGETESITVDSMSSVYSVAGGPRDTDNQSMDATMAVGPMAHLPDIRRTDGDRAKAEQLIVVMGLGERTLSDRLAEVRLEAGAGPKDAAGLQPTEIIRYLNSAASAIDLLNTKHKIYHCDIKPQNILIVGGDAQVCDFGIANRIEGDVKKTSHAIATPAYGAPEVLQDQTYSTTVDQYSLAVTYYELRTGLLPFQATTAAGIAVAKATERLDLARITTAERKVLQRALRVDPKSRYGSCQELVHQLAMATGVERGGGLSPARLALAAAVLALVVGGSVVGWRQAAPEHYQRTMASLFGGPNAAALLEDVQDRLNRATENEQFSPTPDRVEYLLEPLAAARTVSSAEELQRADALGDEATRLLLQRWNAGLDAAAAAGDQQTLAQLSETLQAMKRFFEASSVVSLNDTRAEPLQTAFDLAGLRLALEGVQGADDVTVAANNVRSRLIDHEASLDAGLAPRNIAAVAVALSWLERDEADLQSEAAVEDIKRAERVAVIPDIYASRWSLLYNDAIQAMRAALVASDTNAMQRDHISENFPTLAVDAAIADVKQSIAAGQWDVVPEQLAHAKQLASGDLTGVALQQVALLDAMLRAVEQPSEVGAALEELGQLDAADARNLTAPELRSLITAWLSTLGQRWLETAPTPETLQLAIDARQEAMTLPESIRVAPPRPIDASIVAIATHLGPQAVVRPEVVEAAEMLLKDDALGALGAAARLEALANAEPSPPTDRLQELNTSLSQPAAPASLAVMPAGYHPFTQGLGLWLTGDEERAIQVWDLIAGNAQQLDSLAAPRRIQVATLRLKQLADSSGVSDLDVVRLRYRGDAPAALAELSDIEVWLGAAAKENDNFVQQRMLAGAASDPQWQPSGELAKAISSLRPEALSPQGNRGLFELLRRTVSPAGIERSTNVDLLVRAAAQMLRAAPELTQRYNAADPTAFNEILKPALDVLGRTSRGSDGAYVSIAADGVTGKVQQDLDPEAVRIVCLAFANQASDSYSSTANNEYQTHLATWYRDREFAAATAASLEQQDAAQRQRLWLLAAESFREFQSTEQGGWNDPKKVQTLQTYIDKASSSGVQPPQLQLLNAHLWQYRAALAGTLIERLECFNKAITALSQVIDGSQAAELDAEMLCDARIQRSAVLVKLAFYGRKEDRLSRLELAAKDARAAADAAEQNNRLRQLKADDAYLTLGNAYEDLATYCYTSAADQTRQQESFNDAVKAFERAIKVQGPLVRSSFNARVALGRCLYRYWTAHPSPELLEKAEEELSTIDEQALPYWQAEAHLYRSQLHLAQNEIDEAVNQANQAVTLLERKNDAAVSDRYNAALLTLADALAANQLNSVALKTLDRLQNPTPSEFWKAAIVRASLLAKSGEQKQLLTYAESVLVNAQRDKEAWTVRRDEAGEGLAWIFTLMVIHTEGWSIEEEPPFAKQQVLKLMDQALHLLPAETAGIAAAHRDVIQFQRTMLSGGAPVSAMQRLLSAIETLEQKAPSLRETLVEYRRQVYDALTQSIGVLTKDLPQADKVRVLTQLERLVEATAGDVDDPMAPHYSTALPSLKDSWRLTGAADAK